MKRNGQAAQVEQSPVCVFCGCTEDRACPGGCAWSTWSTPHFPICDQCQAIAGELGEVAQRLVGPAPVFGLELLHYLCTDQGGPQLVLDRHRQIDRARRVKWRPRRRLWQLPRGRKVPPGRRGSNHAESRSPARGVGK